MRIDSAIASLLFSIEWLGMERTDGRSIRLIQCLYHRPIEYKNNNTGKAKQTKRQHRFLAEKRVN
jgi:hypothetical protein